MIYVSKRNAMKVFYYVIMADRRVETEEMALFNEIGQKIDGDNFNSYKMDVIAECRGNLKEATTDDEYFRALCMGIDSVSAESADKAGRRIPVRQAVWNMLAAANADGDYSEAERKLILYIVNKYNVDKSVFLEMEQIAKALRDVSRESEWIKTTDRPYNEIKSIVEELEKRYAVIVKSAEKLIEDEVEGDNPYVEPVKKAKKEILKKSK